MMEIYDNKQYEIIITFGKNLMKAIVTFSGKYLSDNMECYFILKFRFEDTRGSSNYNFADIAFSCKGPLNVTHFTS